MSGTAPPSIAIVGSGPTGCYLAQSLLRALPETEITILDRLPSPYGLVRYGVAADHQHTKAIARQFERVFQDPRVTFAGNVEVGERLGIDELRSAYDAVVFATGVVSDRELDVPGGALPGVFGAGAVTRVLNSHPAEPAELPELGPDVVVVGGGNVAVDVLRFLVKDAAGYAESDVADAALESYLAHPAERVTLLNRSDAAAAKSDPQMLKELAALPRGSYSIHGFDGDLGAAAGASGDRVAAARIAALAALTAPERPARPGPEVSLRFGATPLRILGEDRVEGVEIVAGGRVETIPATSVVTAIGFRPAADALRRLLDEHGQPEYASTGRVAPGVYRVGWAKRGPIGGIPENRSCAKAVAEEILADLESGALTRESPDSRARASRPGSGFEALPESVREHSVSYDQWLRLDRHEREHAPSGRIRRKLSSTRAMLAVARADDAEAVRAIAEADDTAATDDVAPAPSAYERTTQQ
ncbi:FAD-dependent oxidoreductase [Leucobacter weissii]|uniref:ferredoxin--NADP(+) reductase n=1 Tax=Leucobacter weissii TaxID=1983706 RepID=A0A939MK08_9MICO|nr:FAD-dependent oxidoreductase [Leucobacter weissii]MBO1902168.1 FAD-dependent oxidoreductase [Leucobacter weissii]